MRQVMKVSRSGYYDWIKRPPGRRRQDNEELLKAIRKSHLRSRKIYRFRRIHADAKEQFGCGKNRVDRLMKANGIQSVRAQPPGGRKSFEPELSGRCSKYRVGE